MKAQHTQRSLITKSTHYPIALSLMVLGANKEGNKTEQLYIR